MKLVHCLLILEFFIAAKQVNGQDQTKLDNHWAEYKEAKHDTTRIKTYLNIGDVYESVIPDSAIFYYQKAVDLADNAIAGQTTASPLQQAQHNAHTADALTGLKATSLRYIGLVHGNQGLYNQAISYFEKSFKIYEELLERSGNPDSETYREVQKEMSNCCNNIGVVHKEQGSYDKAVEYFDKSLKIYEELLERSGNPDSEAYREAQKGISNCYNNIGVVYSNQGSYDQAISYYKKSFKIFEELLERSGNPDSEAYRKAQKGMSMCYNNIGIVHENQGSYDKAIEYYLKALKINIETGNKNWLSNNYTNIGNVHNYQGSYDKAIEYFYKSLKIDEELGDKNGMSASYNNIGTVHENQGSYDKAIEYYLKAIKTNIETGNKNWLSNNYINIGNVLKDQGSYDKAVEYFYKSLKIKEELGDKNGIARVCGNIASLHISLSDSKESPGRDVRAHLDTALVFGNKSLILAEEIKARPREKSALASLSKIHSGMNKADSAAIYYNRLLEMNNTAIQMNFSFISENEKENYFVTVSGNFMEYYSFALANKEKFNILTENVYNSVMKNKGILLKSSTAMRNAVLQSGDSVLIENYNEWIALKRQVAKKYSDGQDTKDIENKANTLEGELVKSSQIFSDFEKLQNLTWKDVQKGLKPNEAAIEFIHFQLFNPKTKLSDFTDSVMYCALVVTPESKFPKMIPLFEEKQLQTILSQNSNNHYDFVNKVYGNKANAKTELYQLIWKPLEQYLASTKTVYFSPSGLLHKVSFSAIAKDKEVFLCDLYNLKMQSGTGQIAMPEKFNFDENTTASLYGGINYNTDSTQTQLWSYLEGTKVETEKIDALLNKKRITVHYLADTSATEQQFKQLASNSGILHVSTHGFFFPDPKELRENKTEKVETDDIVFRATQAAEYGHGVSAFVRNPNPLMRSGLVFARANDVWNANSDYDYNQEDGVLTALEVAHVNMSKTGLVVMSACETGLGDIKGSEGVYGLQRAFKMAGVKYIIMSLWQVADKETEEFMTMFYNNLLTNKDVELAFSETQHTMRKKYDPYFWAAFVLVK